MLLVKRKKAGVWGGVGGGREAGKDRERQRLDKFEYLAIENVRTKFSFPENAVMCSHYLNLLNV